MSSIPIIRRFANGLALLTLKRASGPNRDWALAMAAEIDAIRSDWRALWFALGCGFVVLRAQSLALVFRRGVAACFFGWAGAKLYFAIWVVQAEQAQALIPGWMSGGAIIAGIAYTGAGLSLLMKNYLALAASLLGVLALNGAVYGVALGQEGSVSMWMMAIALEDYFIWTLSLFGLGTLWWLGHGRKDALI